MNCVKLVGGFTINSSLRANLVLLRLNCALKPF
jgi:hypothetical protein